MQDLPGAPGTARQGRTRTSVSTNDGGVATQPRAPGHERPFTASSGAAKHGRLSAASEAPGADVPLTTTARAPGQYCLSAVPAASGHDRSDARHQRAPGHERPLAASSDVVGHDRPCATPRAPGADVPPAIAAGAPGQHRLSAAHWAPDHFRSRPAPRAPGHSRPLAASFDAVRHDRPRATLRAPGADVPLATTAGAPGQHRLRAMANATVALPAGLRRLRQECLPRVPANPRTPTYCPAHRDTAHNRAAYTHTSANPQSRSTVSSLRLAPQSGPRPPAGRRLAPSPGACSGGGLGRGPLTAHHTTHQAHPAIQVPPYPRSCSAAHTGFLRQNPSRAPPKPTRRKSILARLFPPLHMVERGRG